MHSFVAKPDTKIDWQFMHLLIYSAVYTNADERALSAFQILTPYFVVVEI